MRDDDDDGPFGLFGWSDVTGTGVPGATGLLFELSAVPVLATFWLGKKGSTRTAGASAFPCPGFGTTPVGAGPCVVADTLALAGSGVGRLVGEGTGTLVGDVVGAGKGT